MIGTGIDSFHIRCLFLRSGFHCQQANTAAGSIRIRSSSARASAYSRDRPPSYWRIAALSSQISLSL